MRKTAFLPLLAVLALACVDAGAPAMPESRSETTQAAIDMLMAELSDARTLRAAAKLHGQTIHERIDHVTELLEQLTGQNDGIAADGDVEPRIEQMFTLVTLDVSEPFEDGIPEMMSGKISVYTRATVPGAIAHAIDWEYDSYTDDYTVPEHLANDTLDAIAGFELLTTIGCFYLPNETYLPNDMVDYWAYAETHHLYVVAEPYYREDQYTSDLADTRVLVGSPEVAPCDGAGF